MDRIEALHPDNVWRNLDSLEITDDTSIVGGSEYAES
jgi:hypothetical protein